MLGKFEWISGSFKDEFDFVLAWKWHGRKQDMTRNLNLQLIQSISPGPSIRRCHNRSTEIHRNWFTSKLFYIETVLYQIYFTSKLFYIKTVLHRNCFIPKLLYIKAVLHQNWTTSELFTSNLLTLNMSYITTELHQTWFHLKLVFNLVKKRIGCLTK